MTSAATTTTTTNVAHLRILRLPAVTDRTGRGRTSIYMLEKAGQFPKRVTLGPRCVGWYEHEIDQWLRDRARAVELTGADVAAGA